MMLGIREQLLSLSRIHKRVFMVAFDALAIPFALWSAFYIRLDELLSPEFVSVFTFLPLFIISSLFVFMRLGLYHAITRFIGVEAIRAVLIGVSISTIILLLLVFLYRSEGFPRSVLFIYWLLAVIYVGGTRYLIRQFLNPMPRSVKGRAIIYGAGQAGHQLSMILNHSDDIQPTCFVDDNESLRNNYVNGLKVYSPSEIPGLIENYNIERILLAIPSASKSQIRKILNKLQKYRLHVYTVPSVEDIASGRASVNDIREINIADLLGREIVNPNMKLLHACIENKVVLVTGAGGSIGSELCRQIIDLRARQLILVDSSEFALYQIERELSHKILSDDNYVRILPLLCNVRDRSRLTQIVEGYGVNTIYHAAAYKHVPLVECNIEEGVQNNIFGTLNAAQVAVDSSVETFVLISTDKAVRPTNVMGATKRYAEMILQAMAVEQSVTRFCMVRFGNVLGSSGSVVPAFQKQIREGGPITVTHPDIVRYFMTIPEAAQLVIQAGSMGQGGMYSCLIWESL